MSISQLFINKLEITQITKLWTSISQGKSILVEKFLMLFFEVLDMTKLLTQKNKIFYVGSPAHRVPKLTLKIRFFGSPTLGLG